MRVELYPMFFLEVLHDVFMTRVEIIAAFESHADNLLTIARMAAYYVFLRYRKLRRLGQE